MIRTFLAAVCFMIGHCCLAQQQQAVPAFPHLMRFQNIRDMSLSKNGHEVYFTIQSPAEDKGVIACIKKIKDGWSEPAILSFCGRYRDIEPFLSPDGLRLYFASNRPLNDTALTAKDYDIWFVSRNSLADKWSRPHNVGKPVNSAGNEFYPALTSTGHLYFTSDAAGGLGKDDIRVSRFVDGHYEIPVSLDSNINSSGYEFNAYISPDEKLMMYTKYAAKDGFGSGDLYISKRDEAGRWQKASNMGPFVNSAYMDYCPFYDAETQTLYFTSRRNTIPDKHFPDLPAYEKAITQYENGNSRLYKVRLEK